MLQAYQQIPPDYGLHRNWASPKPCKKYGRISFKFLTLVIMNRQATSFEAQDSYSDLTALKNPVYKIINNSFYFF